MPKLTVIIPTLNEEENIIKTLNSLTERAANADQIELIVVDGGSKDRTQAKVQQWKDRQLEYNTTLLQSAPGRAHQMNMGAQNAQAEVLYFIHADTFPVQNYDRLILEHLDSHHKAGCFRMRFDLNHWWMMLAGWGTRFHWKICRGGDQSLFVEKALFQDVGQYNPKYIICEDLHLIDRLYAQTRFSVLPQAVISSARKYRARGLWQLQWHFWVIQFKYRQGHSPEELWTYYQTHIGNNPSKKE